MNQNLSPEDEAQVRATYRIYTQHLAWIGLSMLCGLAAIVLAMILKLDCRDPAMWILVIYGAGLPAVIGRGAGIKLVVNFVITPVVFFQELSLRVSAISAGRRALKARFGQS